MKQLSPDDFIVFDNTQCADIMRVELSYAQPNNLLFGESIYRSDAKLWIQRDLAQIVLNAARAVTEKHSLRMVVYDSLRTIEAQEKMLKTQRVKDNPHWLEEPRLLSPPGAGAHPRGMAVDVALETLEGGELLDMGTPFDYLAENAAPEKNPAHRDHPHLSENVKKNRKILDEAMRSAAKNLGLKLWPLPQEWWDFRFPPEIYERYMPLSDSDLPKNMRLTD